MEIVKFIMFAVVIPSLQAHTNITKLTETDNSHCQSLDLTVESLGVLAEDLKNVGTGK